MLTQTTPLASTCRTVMYGVAIWAAFAYILGISLFQSAIGGKAATTVIDNYDYSYHFPNSTVSVAIDALPRDIYKDTKNAAGLFLTFPILALTGCVFACGYGFYKRQYYPEEFSLLISSGCAGTITFGYASFMVWKINSLSSDDRVVWDTVDTRFLEVFEAMKGVLAVTVIDFTVWVVIGCIALVRYFKDT